MLAGAHRSHVSDSRYSQAFPTFVMILTWKSLFYVSFLHLCVVGSQKWRHGATACAVTGHFLAPPSWPSGPRHSTVTDLWLPVRLHPPGSSSCVSLISLSCEVMPFSFLNPSNRLAAVFERPGPHTHLTNCTETNAQTIRGRDAAPSTPVVFACTPWGRWKGGAWAETHNPIKASSIATRHVRCFWPISALNDLKWSVSFLLF